MNPEKEWWKPLYDDLLADLLLDATPAEEMATAADFLTKVLELPTGARVLDQCCGTGRLTLAMARRGFIMSGVDLAATYIARARKKAQEAGLEVTFAAADAFDYRESQPCDGVFNWWTSFGYASQNEQNVRMLQRAFESLRPGGRFALDFINVPGLYRHFLPHRVLRGMSGGKPVTLIRESQLDLAAGVVRMHWTYFVENGPTVEHDTEVRLYDPPSLKLLMQSAGFADIRFCGDTDGQPLTVDSPRCILLARRPV